MRRKISIFGATGSVGQNTVDLICLQGGAEAYDVVALSGAGNVALLAKQAIDLQAEIAVTAFPDKLAELQHLLVGTGIECAAGDDALAEAASREINWGMSAIVGAAGLKTSLGIARQGAVLALANKESLVCAGELLLATCAKHYSTLLPVDSEHSAIFQALQGAEPREIARIILTASGGPFLDATLAQMGAVTPEQAADHPKWDMGQRISIDSASLFNKAMEVIEAKHLFDCLPNKIEVVIHPQSIVHSIASFVDGAMLAHMGTPDMRGAIGYALNHPQRMPLPVEPLDLVKMGQLDFSAPDTDRFPALRLAYEVLETGGLSGTAFNASKEAALDAFIAGQIGFLDMAQLVENTLNAPQIKDQFTADRYDLACIVKIDQDSRNFVKNALSIG